MTSSGRRVGTGPAALAAIGVAAALAFAALQAATVRLHPYDAYDYLNDASCLQGDLDATYYRVHAPLVPLLATPIVRALAHAPVDDPMRWTAPHLLGVAMAALSLLACFAWMRERSDARWALLGVLLLASGRLFVHYAHHLLVDIATAGWVALAFFAWSRATSSRGRWRHFALFGAAVAGGMLTKYALGLLPIAFVASELLRAAIERAIGWRRVGGLFVAGAVAVVIFWGTLSYVFFAVDGDAFTPTDFGELLGSASAMVSPMEGETRADYLPMLLATVPLLTLALAALGAIDALRTDWRRELPVLLWIAIFGGVLSLRVPHNEARYLWPILPALAWLAVRGARVILRAIRERAPRPARPVAIAACVLAVGVTTVPGIRQARRDRHPFYRDDTQAQLARWVQENAAGGKVFWAGHFVALTPPDPNPDLIEDEFFDYFHLGHPTVHYLTDASVEGVDGFPDPLLFLRHHPGASDVYVVGPAEFVFAYAVAHGAVRPTTFDAYARRRFELTLDGDRLRDLGGVEWMRVVETEPRVTLEALRDMGEVDLAARPVVGVPVSLGRHTLARGERTAVRGGWTRRGARIEVVSTVKRTFRASWAEAPGEAGASPAVESVPTIRGTIAP